MSGKDISAIGIFKGFDFNNDGNEDIIIVERGGQQFEGKDAGGNKIDAHLDYVEYRPYISKVGTNFFSPFDPQDKCRLEVSDGIAWLYYRPEPFFYDKSGTRFFSAGQNVWVNGHVDQIEGFRVTVKNTPDSVQADAPEIVLKGCHMADFSGISWATPAGERLDYAIITGLAAGAGDAKTATKAEKEMAKIFADIKKIYNGDLKVAATTLESKIAKGIGKDWRLVALLNEGLKKFLTKQRGGL